ncbi:PREDICTED: uncharacterized protein LOC108684446 [Atta colombica]|uniref:uncharacterized protein LOC108684446 n=1 Tax=Atta colombica TaxID=520822 RepID=UPI00084BC9D3|nr:PREDICTED: uncharacterized protein LOC108684446 [Atta colombica]
MNKNIIENLFLLDRPVPFYLEPNIGRILQERSNVFDCPRSCCALAKPVLAEPRRGQATLTLVRPLSFLVALSISIRWFLREITTRNLAIVIVRPNMLHQEQNVHEKKREFLKT